MHQAIKDLHNDTDIIIDKADATVIRDHTEYVSKMNALLNKRLKKDATTKIETKVTKALERKECIKL